MRVERAPAKVNLTLHVLGRRPDGWHALESLVAFAGCGDAVALDPDAPPGVDVAGPFAQALAGEADNLVLRAARELAARAPGLRVGRFRIVKRLPVAAGLGGGSADAAAALRLLARLNGIAADDPRLVAAAVATGSDVPVCLDPRTRMMRGRGEDIGPRLALPPLFALLANPRAPVETRRVFAALGLAPGEAFAPAAAGHPDLAACADAGALRAALAGARNDLEAQACAVEPRVAQTLQALAALPGARLARMSGSGATCFALFDDCRAAARARAALAAAQPGWWLSATVLR